MPLTNGNLTEREWRGILAGIGRTFRPPQYLGALEIDAIYSRREGCLLVEAPTGVGKTLMYLGPLKRRDPGRRVLVSTSGKLLQEQIRASAAELDLGASVVLKGRANYVCVEACMHYLEEWKSSPGDYPLVGELGQLIELVGELPVPDTAELLAARDWSGEFRAFLRHHLTASSAFCRAGHPGRSGGCYYQRLLERAKTSRVLITNHHALLSLAAAPGEDEELLNDRTLIADEAHAFGDAASSVFTLTVASAELRDLERHLKRCAARLAPPLRRAVEARAEVIADFCAAVAAAAKSPLEVIERYGANEKFLAARKFAVASLPPADECSEVPGALRSELTDLLAEFGDLRDALRNMVGIAAAQPRPEPVGNDFQKRCQLLAEDYGSDEKSVMYFEDPGDGDWAIKCTLIEYSELLEPFWKPFSGSVALSATLTVDGTAGGFGFFAASCGLPRNREERILPSVFDLEKQCLIFVPRADSDFSRLASVDPARFLRCRADLTAQLARAFRGRTLALFTAVNRLRAVSAVLEPIFEKNRVCEVLTQDGSVSNDELAKKFVEKTDTLLLGSRSFFQGFDAPGETLSCLILEKLPFDRVDDPVLAARMRKAGQNAFATVQLPSMLLALRQAFGRLLRRESDRGIFVLADPRFTRPGCRYGEKVRRALGDPKELHYFSDPQEILKRIGGGFLPFAAESPADVRADFEEEWKRFTASALFRELTAGMKSLEDVLKKLKIKKLRPWQKTIVDNILAGVSAQLAVYPAGSGKSLTYQLPALMRPGLTLVISPLVSLMFDQVNALHAKGVYEADCLNSKMSPAERRAVLTKLVQGKLRLLYVAPERLHHTFIAMLQALSQEISMLVIDEAHMISEAGSQWRPLYGELAEARKLLDVPQLLAVTATADANIRRDMQEQFDIDGKYVFRNTVVRKFVKLQIRVVGSLRDHFDYAREFVLRAKGRPVLIYCSTPDFVESLVSSPEFQGIAAVTYYTGKSGGRALSAAQLALNHQLFITGQVNVMVATNAYGMGIDKPDIWGVLYNNVPASLEELVQGIGRICRDEKLLMKYAEQGDPATAEISYNASDLYDVRRKVDPGTGEVHWVGKGQLGWKILEPFEKIKHTGLALLGNIIAAKLAPCEVDLAAPDGNLLLGQEADELKKVCILLARFLRQQGFLKRSFFDWESSKYVFEMKKPCVPQLTAGFGQWCVKQCSFRVNQLEEVGKFCRVTGCLNRYLETYFSGRDPKVDCAYCDNCGRTDNDLHREFVAAVDCDYAPPFRHGVFTGDAADFADYLERSRGNRAIVAYLFKEARASGENYCDADFAAALLQALNEFTPMTSPRLAELWLDELYRDFAAAPLSPGSRRKLEGILAKFTVLSPEDHTLVLKLCAPELSAGIAAASGAEKLAKYEEVARLLDSVSDPLIRCALSETEPGDTAETLHDMAFSAVREAHPRLDSAADADAWSSFCLGLFRNRPSEAVESVVRENLPFSPADYDTLAGLSREHLLPFRKACLDNGAEKNTARLARELGAIRSGLDRLENGDLRGALSERLREFCGIYGLVCADAALLALWTAAVSDPHTYDYDTLQQIARGAEGVSADDLEFLEEALSRHANPGMPDLLMAEADAAGERVNSAADLESMLPLSRMFVKGWAELVDGCLKLESFPDFNRVGALPPDVRGAYKQLADGDLQYFLRRLSKRLSPPCTHVDSLADIDKLKLSK